MFGCFLLLAIVLILALVESESKIYPDLDRCRYLALSFDQSVGKRVMSLTLHHRQEISTTCHKPNMEADTQKN